MLVITVIFYILTLIGFFIAGRVSAYKAIEEVETGNRTIINELNKEITGLRKQINESNT